MKLLTARHFRFFVSQVVNKNAISILRIGSIAAVMLGERFVYFTYPIYIYIGSGNMVSMERGFETFVGRRRRNWQSFFPSSSPIPRFIPPSLPACLLISWAPTENRATFRNPRELLPRAPSRPLFPLYPNCLSITTFYSSPLPRASRLSKYFVILENGVSRKETDFIRERALYARLNPIFLFLPPRRFVGILTHRNSSSLFIFGRNRRRQFYFYFHFSFVVEWKILEN